MTLTSKLSVGTIKVNIYLPSPRLTNLKDSSKLLVELYGLKKKIDRVD